MADSHLPPVSPRFGLIFSSRFRGFWYILSAVDLFTWALDHVDGWQVGRRAMDLETISHYKIAGLLGAGGMGEVYLAEDLRLRRKVAIKILRSDSAFDQEKARRFEKEARTASALSHPNIITVFDVGETESYRYIVTEFVDGQTLREYAARARPPLRRSVEIMVKVAQALDAAHLSGIVHRDVKPDNIMIRRDGEVKVVDFGLAKLSEAAGPETSLIVTTPGMIMGTPKYMSPEQVRGFDVDRTSDVFSLGVVFYELLTGVPPFDGNTVSDMIAAVLTKDPVPISTHNPAVPVEIRRVIERCLEKECGGRYPGMTRLIFDLERTLEGDLEHLETERPEVQSSMTDQLAARASVPDANAATIPLPVPVNSRQRRSVTAVAKEPPLAAMLIAALLVASLAGFGVWLASRGPAAEVDSTTPARVSGVSPSADEEEPNWSERTEPEIDPAKLASVKAGPSEAADLNVSAAFFDDRQRKAPEERPGDKGVRPPGLAVPQELMADGIVKQKRKLGEMTAAGYALPMDFADMAEKRLRQELVEVPMATRSYYLDVGGSAPDVEFSAFSFREGAVPIFPGDRKYSFLKGLADNFSGERYDLNEPSDRQQMRRRLLRMLQPRTRAALESAAQSYYSKFGRPLRVVSLTRPIDYQIKISSADPNEYVVRDDTSAPPHSSGCSFDIAREHMPAAEQNFVMEELARMEREGVIDAMILFGENPGFHVFTYFDGHPPVGL